MGRYVAKPTTTVSQEGFFSTVGKILATAAASYSRGVIVGSIIWDADHRPEVNGIPQKNFQQLILTLKQVATSGEVWDMTLLSGTSDGAGALDCSVLVFVGTGSDVRVRLPGYSEDSYTAQVANLLIEDVKLKQVA